MLQRFFESFNRHARTRTMAAQGLYSQIVSAARQPVFYRDWGVPDTVDGRFDAILCHVALVIGRLQNCNDGVLIAQKLFDVMFRDMDKNLREIGVGDMSVRKHFKRMSRFFNGRVRHYIDAFQTNDSAMLTPVLVRNLYRKTDVSEQSVMRMASYLLAEWARLAALPDDAILSGALEFQPPSP